MEAVTAVKIQTVYDNPLNAEKPLTETASNIKNAMSNGPLRAIFSVKTKKRNTTRNTIENPNAILYPLIFFMNKVKFKGKYNQKLNINSRFYHANVFHSIRRLAQKSFYLLHVNAL